MRKMLISITCICIVILNCTSTRQDTVYQVSTIDALLAGVYDGEMTCGTLLNYGNLGIGTFDGLDGEMIIIDDRMFQVKADGKVYDPAETVKTPFAAVCEFAPEKTVVLSDTMNYAALQARLDSTINDFNVFYGIKIRGKFSTMHTRSVPAQSKPYPMLAEVAKHQPEFRMNNVNGTVVGFRCPAFVKGINVPGYHLHFLSDDLKQGGHILGFTLTEVIVEIDQCHQFTLMLPENIDSMKDLDLSIDRSKELEEVEK